MGEAAAQAGQGIGKKTGASSRGAAQLVIGVTTAFAGMPCPPSRHRLEGEAKSKGRPEEPRPPKGGARRQKKRLKADHGNGSGSSRIKPKGGIKRKASTVSDRRGRGARRNRAETSTGAGGKERRGDDDLPPPGLVLTSKTTVVYTNPQGVDVALEGGDEEPTGAGGEQQAV